MCVCVHVWWPSPVSILHDQVVTHLSSKGASPCQLCRVRCTHQRFRKAITQSPFGNWHGTLRKKEIVRIHIFPSVYNTGTATPRYEISPHIFMLVFWTKRLPGNRERASSHGLQTNKTKNYIFSKAFAQNQHPVNVQITAAFKHLMKSPHWHSYSPNAPVPDTGDLHKQPIK